MLDYDDRALHAKIIIAGIILPVIIISPMIIAFYLYDKNTAIQSRLDKAKAVCLTAESISVEQGCEFIPAAAGNKDFDLSFTDRRSFTQNHFAGDKPKDFYQVDHSRNVLCYTAFVNARKSCLSCHGDPRKSKKLWVQGSESITMPPHLSGLKEGDAFGVYEVTTGLSKGEGIPVWFIAGIIVLAGMSIYSISFFAVVFYVINQHREQQNETVCYDWQIYDLEQSSRDLSAIGGQLSSVRD